MTRRRKLKLGTKKLRDRVRRALGVVKAPRRPSGTPPASMRVNAADMISPPPPMPAIAECRPRPVQAVLLSPKTTPLRRAKPPAIDSELAWAVHMRACTPVRPSSLRPLSRSAGLARSLRRGPLAATIDAAVSATMGLRRVSESDAPWDVSSRMLRQRVPQGAGAGRRRSRAKSSTDDAPLPLTPASHGDEWSFNAAAASAALEHRADAGWQPRRRGATHCTGRRRTPHARHAGCAPADVGGPRPCSSASAACRREPRLCRRRPTC